MCYSPQNKFNNTTIIISPEFCQGNECAWRSQLHYITLLVYCIWLDNSQTELLKERLQVTSFWKHLFKKSNKQMLHSANNTFKYWRNMDYNFPVNCITFTTPNLHINDLSPKPKTNCCFWLPAVGYKGRNRLTINKTNCPFDLTWRSLLTD